MLLVSLIFLFFSTLIYILKKKKATITCALLVLDPTDLVILVPTTKVQRELLPVLQIQTPRGSQTFLLNAALRRGTSEPACGPPRPCYFTLPFPGYMVWEPDFTSCNFLIVPPMDFKTQQLGRWLCPRQGVDESREQRTGPYTGQKGERWVGFLSGHTLLSIPGEEHSLLSPGCSRFSSWLE